MARKGCFEVTKLEFNFFSTNDEAGRTKLVSDGMETFFKKYASGTKYEISHELYDVLCTDVYVTVEFSKSISMNTVNKLLSKMAISNIEQISYRPSIKEVIISVVG